VSLGGFVACIGELQLLELDLHELQPELDAMELVL